jgi:hypothetical protein
MESDIIIIIIFGRWVKDDFLKVSIKDLCLDLY